MLLPSGILFCSYVEQITLLKVFLECSTCTGKDQSIISWLGLRQWFPEDYSVVLGHYYHRLLNINSMQLLHNQLNAQDINLIILQSNADTYSKDIYDLVQLAYVPAGDGILNPRSSFQMPTL